MKRETTAILALAGSLFTGWGGVTTELKCWQLCAPIKHSYATTTGVVTKTVRSAGSWTYYEFPDTLY